MSRITLIPALIAAAVLGACEKGSEPTLEPKAALVAHDWKTAAHTVSPGVKSKPADKPVTDYATATGDCHPNPEIHFDKDGRFAFSDGPNRCGFGTGDFIGGRWTLSDDGKTLTLDKDTEEPLIVWKVKSLVSGSLTVEFPMEGTVGDGTPQTEVVAFRKK